MFWSVQKSFFFHADASCQKEKSREKQSMYIFTFDTHFLQLDTTDDLKHKVANKYL